MCVMLHKLKENKPFDITEIEDACKYNNDGFSITILTNDGVDMLKTVDLKSFVETYKEMYDNKLLDNVEYIIHCRIATNGKVCKKNCHPFENDNYILWHNGVISEFSSDKDKVDSEQFLNKYFMNANMKEETIMKKLNSVSGSRFVLYDKNTKKVYQSDNMLLDEETGNYRSNENHLWATKWNKYSAYDKYNSWYDDYDYWHEKDKKDEDVWDFLEKDIKKMTRKELETYAYDLRDMLYEYGY